MNKETKTKQGYSVCRRCDQCGTRIGVISAEDKDICILKCGCCGQEYCFRCAVKDRLCAASGLAHTECR